MPFKTPGGFIPISFTVGNAAPIERKLATFGARITDMSPVWEQIGEDLLGDFEQNFASEGDLFKRSVKLSGKTFRVGWAQLARSTVQERLRLGYGGEHPILERTGQLRQSLTERGTPGNVFIVAANGVEVGTLVPYAKFHQYGTVNMIERPIVGLTWQRRQDIMVRLREYVAGIIRDQG